MNFAKLKIVEVPMAVRAEIEAHDLIEKTTPTERIVRRDSGMGIGEYSSIFSLFEIWMEARNVDVLTLDPSLRIHEFVLRLTKTIAHSAHVHDAQTRVVAKGASQVTTPRGHRLGGLPSTMPSSPFSFPTFLRAPVLAAICPADRPADRPSRCWRRLYRLAVVGR